MILILELMDEAVTHAPGNSQWAQVIARALPDHQVRVCAPPAHLRALREDANLCALANVSFREIPLISAFRRQVNVVSPARARAGWRRGGHHTRPAPPGGPTTPPA